MGGYKLVYFNVRGLGEAIRYLLKDNEISFEEVLVETFEEFQKDWKPKMQFGQVPCLYDGDFQLVQSGAILRYLARKHGLYGTNEQEAAKIDMLNDCVMDLRNLYITLIYQNYEAGKEDFIKNLSSKLAPFENLLKESGAASSGAAVGGKKSFADYNLFDLLDNLQVLSPGCLDTFPALKTYFSKMEESPAIEKHRSTEAFKSRPINGNGKQ